MLWVLVWVGRREFGRPRDRVFVWVVDPVKPLGGLDVSRRSQGRRPRLLPLGVGESHCGTAHYLGYCVVFEGET